jgi:hypothetical protein
MAEKRTEIACVPGINAYTLLHIGIHNGYSGFSVNLFMRFSKVFSLKLGSSIQALHDIGCIIRDAPFHLEDVGYFIAQYIKGVK